MEPIALKSFHGDHMAFIHARGIVIYKKQGNVGGGLSGLFSQSIVRKSNALIEALLCNALSIIIITAMLTFV